MILRLIFKIIIDDCGFLINSLINILKINLYIYIYIYMYFFNKMNYFYFKLYPLIILMFY